MLGKDRTPETTDNTRRLSFSSHATYAGLSQTGAGAPVGELPGQLAASALTPRPFALTPGASPGGRGESTAFPPIAAQVASLFHSAVAFVGDGCAVADDAEYRRRLDVCRNCDRRVGKRCTECGCWIGLKARGRAFTCPLGRWEQQVR